MKLIIFADSHDRTGGMTEAIEYENPDYIFHLGDLERDADVLSREFPQIPLHYVPGNCDFFPKEPYRKLILLCGRRIFMCHGHTYYVKTSYDSIINNACAAGADVLLFGHTHEPFYTEINGLTVINPGSVGFGRTYGVLTLDGSRLEYRLKSIGDNQL